MRRNHLTSRGQPPITASGKAKPSLAVHPPATARKPRQQNLSSHRRANLGASHPNNTTAIAPLLSQVEARQARVAQRQYADHIRQTWQAANEALTRQDWPAALTHLLAIAALRPDYPQLGPALARAYNHLDNRDLALRTLRDHLARHDDDPAAWWQLSEMLAGPTERHECLAALERVATLDPSRTEARLRMARLWWALGNGDLARRHVREGLYLAPRNAEAHHLLGLIYEKWGRLADGLRELRLARELESDAPDLPARIVALCEAVAQARQTLTRLRQEATSADTKVLYNLATYEVHLADIPAALEICDRVLATQPQLSEFLELRAKLLVEHDRPEEGLAAAAEAANASGDPAVNGIYRRRVENRFGPPDRRWLFHQSQIRQHPEQPEAYLNMALLLAAWPPQTPKPADGLWAGDQTSPPLAVASALARPARRQTSPATVTPPNEGWLTAALRCLAEGLRINPDHVGLLTARGDVLAAADRLSEAQVSYQQALDEAPRDPRLHDRLAQVHLLGGEVEPARTALRRALELAPQFDRAHRHLGVAAEMAGDWDDAIAAYRKTLRANRRCLSARWLLAAALRRQNRLEEAEECLRQLLADHPQEPTALALMAGIAQQRGHLDTALALLEESATPSGVASLPIRSLTTSLMPSSRRKAPWSSPATSEFWLPIGLVEQRLVASRLGPCHLWWRLIEWGCQLAEAGQAARAVACLDQGLGVLSRTTASLGGTSSHRANGLERAAQGYIAANQPRRTVAILSDLLAVEGDRLHARLVLARANLALGRAAAARRQALQVLDLAENLSPAWVVLGQAHEALGQYDKAAGAFRKALELDTRCGAALIGLLGLFGQPGVDLDDTQRRDLCLRAVAFATDHKTAAALLADLSVTTGHVLLKAMPKGHPRAAGRLVTIKSPTGQSVPALAETVPDAKPPSHRQRLGSRKSRATKLDAPS